MKKSRKRCLVLVAVFLMSASLFIACWKVPHTSPVMTDRTVNWEPHVKYRDFYNLLTDPDNPLFHSFLFAKSGISKEKPYYVDLKDDTAVIMENALKEAFRNEYIDIGDENPEIERREFYTTVIYTGGETCVIIDSADGRIMQCIDTRIQEQFQGTTFDLFKRGLAYITTDLSSLSNQEVRLLAELSNGFSEEYIPRFFVEEQNCPLDAISAFEAASKILYKAYPSGKWEYIGDGEYAVYDAEASNCWLIVAEMFTLMLDKDTGEKVFFSVQKDGFSDLSIKTS